MTPLERFEAGLAKLQSGGCEIAKPVQKVQQDYNKEADQVDQRLQGKQERELRKLLG